MRAPFRRQASRALLRREYSPLYLRPLRRHCRHSSCRSCNQLISSFTYCVQVYELLCIGTIFAWCAAHKHLQQMLPTHRLLDACILLQLLFLFLMTFHSTALLLLTNPLRRLRHHHFRRQHRLRHLSFLKIHHPAERIRHRRCLKNLSK